jgi:hypothetical protein
MQQTVEPRIVQVSARLRYRPLSDGPSAEIRVRHVVPTDRQATPLGDRQPGCVVAIRARLFSAWDAQAQIMLHPL